jgi:LCP family protein required for cell wall assembly
MFGGTIIMSKDEKKENNKFKKIVLVIFLVLALLSSAFAIFEIFLLSSIENLIRYLVIVFLGLLDLVFILKTRRYIKGKKKKKNKKPKTKLFVFLMILYTIICFCIGGAIYYLYGKINNLNKTVITYTSDLLVMSTNSANDISDISDMTIGILSDKTSPEGYIIPEEIIKENNLEDENEIKKYDDYTSMLVDMYAGDIDGMFVSDSYVSMFSGITGYENIETDTKVIISKDKKMKKSSTSSIETASSGKSITEPFTILLMGIDSTDEVLTKNAIANGDTLILITFNPKTLNATMISIPRDSYVPIACWSGQPENKITHAAAYGNDCMINTIQNYFDVTIDYYAKINFKGLVKLVDAVGGVDINVEQTLCTDNSNRENEVCITPGQQTLNGEQALVYARNRKSLVNGDFGRGQHQQEIVMALINKMKTINDVNTFMDILNTVSNSIDTNLTTKQILSFYNIGKDIIKKSLSSDDADLINIQQLYLQGTGQMIYDERAKMILWDYVPNKSSRKDIIQAMKVNLELASHEDIKEFSFSINDPYEKTVIGKGPYNTSFSYTLLPDFTGLTEAQARATASRYGVTVTFKGSSGTVVSQSYPASKRVDLISGSVTLTLSGASVDSETTSNKEVSKKDDTEDKTIEKDDTSANEGADTDSSSGTGSDNDNSGSTDSESDS